MTTEFTSARIRRWGEDLPIADPDPRVAAVLDEFRVVARHATERAIRLLQAVDDEDALRAELGDDIREALRARPFADDAMGPVARVIRRRRGVTIAQVARRAGRHPSTISSWEDGRRSRLTVVDTGRIADALGVSLLALFRLTGEARGKPQLIEA